MIEVKMHTTLYFNVPMGESPTDYIEELLSLSKEELLTRATDVGDGEGAGGGIGGSSVAVQGEVALDG